MDKINDITGVILAGGHSTRFGSNKALAMVDGKPLVQHVTDTVAAIFDDCLLVTNTPEQYDFLNIPMIRDRYQEMGPLAGIHAALRHTGKSWIFVVACDMPNLSPELIQYLCNIDEQECDAIIPWLEKGPEPLFGIYNKKSLAVIDSHLQQKDCQVTRMLEDLQVRRISAEEILSITGDLTCFKNINRPTDL